MLKFEVVETLYYDLTILCSALLDLHTSQLQLAEDAPSPLNILLVMHARLEELLERYELDVLNPLKSSLGGEGGAM